MTGQTAHDERGIDFPAVKSMHHVRHDQVGGVDVIQDPVMLENRFCDGSRSALFGSQTNFQVLERPDGTDILFLDAPLEPLLL